MLTAAAEQTDDWLIELQAYGLDVQEELDRGSLVVQSQQPSSRPLGALLEARDLWRLLESLFERFEAVWLLREEAGSSALGTTPEQLCQSELTRTLLLQDSDVRAICEYDLTRHSPAVIDTALRTHPWVVLDGKVRENRFYDGPSILEREPQAFASDADAARIERMVTALRQAC